MAIESGQLGVAADEGIPFFLAAGTEADGEYSCANCGYGIAVRRALPACPMCGGDSWEPLASSPFISR